MGLFWPQSEEEEGRQDFLTVLCLPLRISLPGSHSAFMTAAWAELLTSGLGFRVLSFSFNMSRTQVTGHRLAISSTRELCGYLLGMCREAG